MLEHNSHRSPFPQQGFIHDHKDHRKHSGSLSAALVTTRTQPHAERSSPVPLPTVTIRHLNQVGALPLPALAK